MSGQTLVPLAQLRLGNGLHEVPLQLADAGVVPEQLFLRLVEVLREGKVHEKTDDDLGGDKSKMKCGRNLRIEARE